MTTYYSEDHEWISVEGENATVGITAHAAEKLGDIVFIDFREVGLSFNKTDEIGVVESVKAAAEIYAPVSGEITEANTVIADDPARLNENPEGEAWLYRIRLSDPSELEQLMDAETYQNMIG